MKKSSIFLVLFTLITFICTAQNNGIKIIPSEYSSSNKSPLKFTLGDTLQINCDTIFIVNKGRYNFYKNIHSAIQNDNDSLCNMLLKAYEIRLQEHEKSFIELLENSRNAEKKALELLAFTQKSLIDVQKTLTDTQNAMDNTRKNLEDANRQIKKERWNSAGKKIMIGVGGVAVGLITGVLIMR
jgi:ElaB/YqjD/DUF883 family membrane-anchored ribosome-binding protein